MRNSTGSVTRWIDSFKQGDPAAAAQLWDIYSIQLLAFARKQLGGVTQIDYDEDDAVSSAFFSAFVSLQKRSPTSSMHRNEFWSFVATITARKICRQIARNKTQKRDIGRKTSLRNSGEHLPCGSLVDNPQHPDRVAEFTDQFRHLMEMLPGDDLRKMVELKLEGFTNREIATQLNRGISTIERKFRAIRAYWESSLDTDSTD